MYILKYFNSCWLHYIFIWKNIDIENSFFYCNNISQYVFDQINPTLVSITSFWLKNMKKSSTLWLCQIVVIIIFIIVF